MRMLPLIWIVPASAASCPASSFRSVDLPAPFGPISPMRWFGLMVHESPCRIGVPPNARCMLLSWIMQMEGIAIAHGVDGTLSLVMRDTSRRRLAKQTYTDDA